MVLDVLKAAVDWIFKALEGLIKFFEELIPLLLQLLFAISPFVLLTIVLYIFLSKAIAAGVGIFFLAVLIIGAIWALKNPVTGATLSTKVIVYILIFDLAMGVTIAVKKDWVGKVRTRLRSQQTESSQPAQSTADAKKNKEEIYLTHLKESIEKDNTNEILRALTELRKMKSQAAIPYVIQLLRQNYPSASYGNSPWNISISAIDTLVELNTKEGCELLYEIQVKSSQLSYKAQEIIAKICDSS